VGFSATQAYDICSMVVTQTLKMGNKKNLLRAQNQGDFGPIVHHIPATTTLAAK
jgi:hypothetical protein